MPIKASLGKLDYRTGQQVGADKNIRNASGHSHPKIGQTGDLTHTV